MTDETLTREKDKEINPYQRIVVNNIVKDNVKTSQLVHWYILSNIANYVKYDKDANK